MSLLLSTGGGVGDIWSTGAFSFESPLKDLLDSGDYSVEELLAEDELLQELRGVHQQLIPFFSTEYSVTKLIDYMIHSPESGVASKSANEATTSEEDSSTPKNSNTSSSLGASNNAVGAVESSDSDEMDGSAKAPINGILGDNCTTDKSNNHETDCKRPGVWLQGNYEPSPSESTEKNAGGKPKHPERDPEMRFVRFPYMACEIFCCEIESVINIVVDGYVVRNERLPGGEGESADDVDEGQPQQPKQRILDLLFSLLHNTPAGQMDDYRAGYLDKVLMVLFRKRPEDLASYVNSGGGHPDGAIYLMKAMFRHFNAHSIMQIAQRLLLPPRPVPPKLLSQTQVGTSALVQASGTSAMIDPTGASGDDDEAAAILVVSGVAATAGAEITAGEDDDDQDPNAMDGTMIRCDWSKSSQALDLLVQNVIGTSEDIESLNATITDPDALEEQRIDRSVHASEVIITMVQNSMLTSDTMLTLTSSEYLHRLIMAATTIPLDENGEECMSPHESLMTTAMNVLESLILQLGGYGAIGTMSLLPEGYNQDAAINNSNNSGSDSMIEDTEGTGMTDCSSADDEAASGGTAAEVIIDATVETIEASAASRPLSSTAEPPSNVTLIADLTYLSQHLPLLLSRLSLMLRHPSTQLWTSPRQFSRTEPMPMLGSCRLRIVRVLESLVLLGDPEVDSQLAQSDCLEICLDLFWEFQWCSMLHQSVANLLVHVFEGQNARIEMQAYFLVRCNLLGRLMDSFVERPMDGNPNEVAISVGDNIDGLVMNMNEMTVSEFGTPPESSQEGTGGGSAADQIPVSEDDVDAAMETQDDVDLSNTGNQVDIGVVLTANEMLSTEAVLMESRDASTLGGIGSPSQSFRYGYMGHVIIICQALVHACAAGIGTQEAQDNMANSAGKPEESDGMTGDIESQQQQPPLQQAVEPLMMAELVLTHSLSEPWQEFVSTTLATETAIQSTPLGGYGSSVGGGDSLHHRAGPDDGDIGDDILGPPSRSMVGDLIDMDDNDLEMAATMMAGMSIGRSLSRSGSDDGSSGEASHGSGDSERSYNSGETNDSGSGYAFDDPLGKSGVLGIELGKLTQYSHGTNKSRPGRKKPIGETALADDDDDSSSSDEGPGSRSDEDVPVMNLFAGNFNTDDSSPSGENAATPDWSNFANFDDAAVDTFGAFSESTDAPMNATPTDEKETEGGAEEAEWGSPVKKTQDLDDIFGTSDHSSLLIDDDDVPTTSTDAVPLSSTDRSSSLDHDGFEDDDLNPEGATGKGVNNESMEDVFGAFTSACDIPDLADADPAEADFANVAGLSVESGTSSHNDKDTSIPVNGGIDDH